MSNPNLIANGGFSNGNKKFGSAYDYIKANPNHSTISNEYSIVSNPGLQFANGLDNYGDHSGNAGKMLFVDGTAAGAFWSQGVTLAASTTYSFTYFVTGADATSPAQIALSVNGATIDGGFQITGSGGGDAWQQVTASFTTASAGSYALALSDLSGAQVGNDFTIDDISLKRGSAAIPNGHNVLENGAFSQGNAGFSSDYQYVTANSTFASNVGQISVIHDPGQDFTNGYDHYGDHSSGSGQMLFVDGTGSGAFWRESVTLAANTTYVFSYYVTGADGSNLPGIHLSLNGATIEAGCQVTAEGGDKHWQQFVETFTTTSAGSYSLALSDNDGTAQGNDFTLDDLRLVAGPTGSPSAVSPEAFDHATPSTFIDHHPAMAWPLHVAEHPAIV